MASCPRCKRQVLPEVRRCPGCGLDLGRARKGAGRKLPPVVRLLVLVLIGVGGGLAVTWGVYRVKYHDRIQVIRDPQANARPERATEQKADHSLLPDFDIGLDLDASPQGLAWNGESFLLGNRVDPWGFVQLVPDEDYETFSRQKLPVVEKTYAQRMSFDAVTWNGSHWVALADGAWFQQQEKTFFVVLDRLDLRIETIHRAPDGLGCLAWDGRSYWAASRRNTADEDVPARLYRIGRNFEVEQRFEPPAVGCQGLTWDGRRLWFADVFEDAIFALDPGPPPGVSPTTVLRYGAGFEYLSGIAWDGEALWVTEYGSDRMRRLRPKLVTAWNEDLDAGDTVSVVSRTLPQAFWDLVAGKRPAGEPLPPPSSSTEPSEPSSSSSGADVAELRRGLRSEDWVVRMKARQELERLGETIDFDVSRESNPQFPGPEDIETWFWQVELRGNDLFASWEIHFGDAFFSDKERAGNAFISAPIFARIELTVRGGTLASEIEKTVDAIPGANLGEAVLAENLGPGTYTVDLFFHVQFEKDGGAKILNKSEMPLSVTLR